MKEQKKKPTTRRHECSFIYCVWFRKHAVQGPPFCVEVTCKTHRMQWTALTGDLDHARTMIDNFPIVCGGMANTLDEEGLVLPGQGDCILGKIPPLEPHTNEGFEEAER